MISRLVFVFFVFSIVELAIAAGVPKPKYDTGAMGYMDDAAQSCAAYGAKISVTGTVVHKDVSGTFYVRCSLSDSRGIVGDEPVGVLCPAMYSYYDGQNACYCPGDFQYFADVNQCIASNPAPPPQHDEKNNGQSCPACGRPINPGTGNMWHTERDDLTEGGVSDLRFSRTYNSDPTSIDGTSAQPSAIIRSFGMRWSQHFDTSITPQSASTTGPVGVCWQRADTKQIWCESAPVPSPTSLPQAVSISRGDGKKFRFSRNGLQWSSSADVADRLTASYNASHTAVTSWSYLSAADGSTERYDANGKLTAIAARNGRTRRLTYSEGSTNDTGVKRVPADAPTCSHVQAGAVLPAGDLLCVTDDWHRQIGFEHDDKNRIVKVFDAMTAFTTYAYDGISGGCTDSAGGGIACASSNLTSVTYPDGKVRTYFYNEASHINGGASCPNVVPVGSGFGHLFNSLTGIVDENGQRYLSWEYDCAGLATVSQVGGGVEKVALAYGEPDANGVRTTTVTHTLGTAANPETTVRQYAYQSINAVAKNLSIDGPCIECGPIKARTYDANGNMATSTDWNGVQTTYRYDQVRNIETSRTEASGTPLARTTTTEWHPSYRIPKRTAEPLLITTMTHDASGNVLTRTLQATTDANGSKAFTATATGPARTWTYTWNTYGQMLTATGPRTDVTDVTTYTYESGTGNLATVTNAAGQVTKLSAYDPNGRVGSIQDPNGAVTTMTYTPRGWLATSATQGAGASTIFTTTYTYDGVGQLKTVTFPAGEIVTYSYDDAHRLYEIKDSQSNKITYALDNMGNHIGETVTDPTGTLARSVTRVIDALNRVKTVTGATL